MNLNLHQQTKHSCPATQGAGNTATPITANKTGDVANPMTINTQPKTFNPTPVILPLTSESNVLKIATTTANGTKITPKVKIPTSAKIHAIAPDIVPLRLSRNETVLDSTITSTPKLNKTPQYHNRSKFKKEPAS